MKETCVLGLLLLLFLSLPTSAQQNAPLEISISSSWGGYGEGKHSELTIRHGSAGYNLNGELIAAQLIEQLVVAIDEPTVNKPRLANFGITKEWLEVNADKGVREYAEEYFSKAAANLQRLYYSTFKNPRLIATLLPSKERPRHTDDYPSIEITLAYDNGQKVSLSSEEQPLFMLPWKITRNGRWTRTYNAHISRAIANLLPDNFANRERIAGEGLATELARDVMSEIKPEWNRLDAENKAGRFLDQLRKRFAVSEVEINGYHSVDHGEEWSAHGPTELNLHVTLKRKDFAKNFAIGAVLPFKEGKVANLEIFLSNIDRFKHTVDSVPWLKRYMAHHHQTKIELRFISNRSLGDKPIKSFAEDMGGLGKDRLIPEITSLKDSISLVVVNNTAFWLVLPDKRMVLWRFTGASGLLKWRPSAFNHKSCLAYSSYSQCSGAFISPSGAIQTK